jgi:hypothetical protein
MFHFVTLWRIKLVLLDKGKVVPSTYGKDLSRRTKRHGMQLDRVGGCLESSSRVGAMWTGLGVDAE